MRNGQGYSNPNFVLVSPYISTYFAADFSPGKILLHCPLTHNSDMFRAKVAAGPDKFVILAGLYPFFVLTKVQFYIFDSLYEMFFDYPVHRIEHRIVVKDFRVFGEKKKNGNFQ